MVNLSQEYQHRSLDREPIALSELAKEFLKRFCMKAIRRRPSISVDRITDALSKICSTVTTGSSRLALEKEWIDAAKVSMIEQDAVFLFDEAISYGLIRVDSRRKWYWRHVLICEYLKRD